MKITFLSPKPNLSGGVRVIAIYAELLRARGHEVTVVASGSAPRKQWAGVKRLLKRRSRKRSTRSHYDGTNVNVRIAPHPGPLTDADVPDADVVIATWWHTAFEAAALSPSKGEKFYFVQHHEVHDHLPSQITRGSYFLPLKKITISQWLVDIMKNEYDDNTVDLVHNSVDMTQFFAPERGKQKNPTIGLLYSDKPFKGLDISLRAIEKVRKKLPNLKVVAFGENAQSPELKLPEDSRYYQSPEQSEIRDIYAQCDVWLCGSKAEGFFLPMLEAMACRCPFVSTRVGGPIDTVENGVNGYLVDIDDSDALAARLVDVLTQSPGQWKAMSDAALAVATRYTWDDACTRFEEAICRVSAKA